MISPVHQGAFQESNPWLCSQMTKYATPVLQKSHLVAPRSFPTRMPHLSKQNFSICFQLVSGHINLHIRQINKGLWERPNLTAVGLCNINMYYRNKSSEIHFPQVLAIHVCSCNTPYSSCRVTPLGPQKVLSPKECFAIGPSMQRQPTPIEVQLFRTLTHWSI